MTNNRNLLAIYQIIFPVWLSSTQWGLLFLYAYYTNRNRDVVFTWKRKSSTSETSKQATFQPEGLDRKELNHFTHDSYHQKRNQLWREINLLWLLEQYRQGYSKNFLEEASSLSYCFYHLHGCWFAAVCEVVFMVQRAPSIANASFLSCILRIWRKCIFVQYRQKYILSDVAELHCFKLKKFYYRSQIQKDNSHKQGSKNKLGHEHGYSKVFARDQK